MSCDQYADRIIAYVTNRISVEDKQLLEPHLASCQACRAEFESYQWLQTSISASRREIDAGHISPRLLYEFIDDPPKLDPETTQFVKSHIGECQVCTEDVVRIRKLHEIALAESQERVTAGRTLWAKVVDSVQRPLVPVFATALVLVITIGVYLNSRNQSEPSFRWEQSIAATARPLPVNLITRGVPEESGDEVPELGGGFQLVTMDLGFLDDLGDSYELVVKNSDEEIVWEALVPIVFVDRGELTFGVSTDVLSAGPYYIDLIEYESDGFSSVIARSAFRVATRR